MKKTYINPTMTVVKVKTRSLLVEVSQPQLKVNSSGAPVDAGDVESRSFSIWDGDEE